MASVDEYDLSTQEPLTYDEDYEDIGTNDGTEDALKSDPDLQNLNTKLENDTKIPSPQKPKATISSPNKSTGETQKNFNTRAKSSASYNKNNPNQTQSSPLTSGNSQLRRDSSTAQSSNTNLRRSSSVPPGSRGKPNLYSAISIRASDANSIVDLYEKSRISIGGPVDNSTRNSIGRSSISSGFSGDQLAENGEADFGRSIDARRARKIAHEQAVLLENRVSRLQRLEDLYKKRIKQTIKQTDLIKSNKERHQQDLVEKYKQKIQQVEEIKKLSKENTKKAEILKQSVKESRIKCLLEKKKRVEEEKRESERRKQLLRKEEINIVKHKRIKINNMSTERQALRYKRKQSFSEQIQKKFLENSEHIAFEAQLRQKLNERSDIMCDKELQAIDRLKKLEEEQQKAVKALRLALS